MSRRCRRVLGVQPDGVYFQYVPLLVNAYASGTRCVTPAAARKG